MGARALARRFCAPLLERVLRVCPSVPLLLLLLRLFFSGKTARVQSFRGADVKRTSALTRSDTRYRRMRTLQ